LITKKDRILYIPIGLPGCGKTWNRKRDALILCKDDIRFMLLNYEQTDRDFYLDSQNGDGVGKITLEEQVKEIFEAALQSLLGTGYNIYLDGTNLIAEHRVEYIRRAHAMGYKIHFILFKNHYTAIFRNSIRKRRVPNEIINNMFRNKEELTQFEKIMAYKIEVRKTVEE